MIQFQFQFQFQIQIQIPPSFCSMALAVMTQGANRLTGMRTRDQVMDERELGTGARERQST